MKANNAVKNLLAGCVATVMMFSLFACNTSPASTGTPAQTPAGTGTQQSGSAKQPAGGAESKVKTSEMLKTLSGGGIKSRKDSMIVVIQADPSSFDPAESVSNYRFQTLRQIYETLVIYDENGTLTPWLAESWNYENDRTIVLKIRKGVKFHSGDELKAGDVLFSLKRLVDDNTAGAMQVNRINFKKSEAVDDYTVKLVLDEPYAIQINQLENPLCGIISEKTYKANSGKIGAAANGTGPYKLVKYTPGDSTILQAFDGYWIKGQPYVKNVTLRYITDASSRAIEAESGGSDIVYDIAAADLNRLLANPKLVVYKKPGAKTEYLTFNQAIKPLDDARVRQAIWLALDRRSLVESTYGGVGDLSTSYVGPNISGRDPNLESYFPTQNVARAKQLLAEAGYANGFKTQIYSNNSDPQRMQFCEAFQAQMAPVGIDVELKFMDAVTWNTLATTGKTALNIYGLTASTGEAGRNLFRFLPGANEWAVFSWTNQEYNDLVNKALSTVDEKARNELYYKCQQMLMKNFILLPMCVKNSVAAGQPNVRGFWISPSYESHLLQYVYFE